MASSYPVQTRAVDPYASYNSNVVNQLTGIVTRGSNALDFYNSLQVIPDSTSVIDHVEVLPGIIYKDDMLIEITSSYRLNFDDLNSYIGITSSPISSIDGIYYVVLEYTYVKSRPAPIAYIKILIPGQTASFRAGSMPSLFFLKAVNILSGSITDMYDYDPDNIDTRRLYLRNYTSTDIGLPTFEAARDQSRITYIPAEDEFYLGYSNRWDIIGGNTFIANTLSSARGDLVYVTSTGAIESARSTLPNTTSDGVVLKSAANGRIQTSGKVYDIPVESSVTVSVGDLLYLSATEAGKVTNQKTIPYWQFVGRCLEVLDSTSVIISYVRGEPNGTADVELAYSENVSLDSTSGWTISGMSYKYDLDVSSFKDGEVIATVWDPDTGFIIYPENIEYVDTNTVSIYMATPQGLNVNLLGASTTSIFASRVSKQYDLLIAGDPSWIPDGPLYYYDVDITGMNLVENGVGFSLRHHTTDELVLPSDIRIDSTSNIRIWMNTDSESFQLVCAGLTSDLTNIVENSQVLVSGASWILSGGLYYQDYDLTGVVNSKRIIVDFIDVDSGEKIVPTLVERGATDTVMRVWMTDDTHNVKCIVVG